VKTILAIFLLSLAFAQVGPPPYDGTPTHHSEFPNPSLIGTQYNEAVTQENIHTTVCKPGYTATVRDVTGAEKKQVMVRYGLPLADLHSVEIDHWISLEIAGANDIGNLWPQYYAPAKGQTGYLGARNKDVVEDWLHRQVCSNAMTLAEAQTAIWMWPELYVKIKTSK
jgi:hypothetical protein